MFCRVSIPGGVHVWDVFATSSPQSAEAKETKSASRASSSAARHAAAGVSALEAFRLWSAPARGGMRSGWPERKSLSIYPQPAPCRGMSAQRRGAMKLLVAADGRGDVHAREVARVVTTRKNMLKANFFPS